MITALISRPRFPSSPNTILDIPLDRSMSAALTQDHSQHANHATLINGPLFQYPGLLVDNDGANDKLAAANFSQTITLPFTLLSWGSIPVGNDNSNLLHVDNNSGNTKYAKLKVHISGSGTPRARFLDGVNNTTSDHTTDGFGDGRWHFYAAVYIAPDDVTLYVDAVKSTTPGTETGTMTDITGDLVRYSLGGNPSTGSVLKDHTMGLSRIENSELSENSIKNFLER